MASILFNSGLAHIFLDFFFFFISVTVLFFIQVRFFNSIETRVLIDCGAIIDISIENISTSGSCLLLFLRLLLLFLCSKGLLKIFLFLLEINKCLPLFFNIFWIIPIIPIRRYRSTAFSTISWSCSTINCTCQRIFSCLRFTQWIHLLTARITASITLTSNNSSCVPIDLRFYNLVLFFGSKFSSKFCLFNLDSNFNCLCIEISINTVHIFQMISFNILGLFLNKEFMSISKCLNN